MNGKTDGVYMRFNNKRAKWEMTGYTWEAAKQLLGDAYDLLLVKDGADHFKPKGKEITKIIGPALKING